MITQFLLYAVDNCQSITLSRKSMPRLFAEKCVMLSQYQESKTFRTYISKVHGEVSWTFEQFFKELWRQEKDWKIQRLVKDHATEYALVTRMRCVPEDVPKRRRTDKHKFYLYRNEGKKAGKFVEFVSVCWFAK